MSTLQQERFWAVMSGILFLAMCAGATLIYYQKPMMLFLAYPFSLLFVLLIFGLSKNNGRLHDVNEGLRKEKDTLKKRVYELEARYCPTVEHLKDAIWAGGVD